MKKKIRFVLIVCFIFVVTGCFEEKLNKTDYKLSYIFEKANYKKDNNSYTMTDVRENKYIFYFDDNDYNNNYYMNIRSKKDNEEARFYYHKDLFILDKCEINTTDKKTNDNCNDSDINKMNSIIFSFNNITNSLGLTKEDLKILINEVDSKEIKVDELS